MPVRRTILPALVCVSGLALAACSSPTSPEPTASPGTPTSTQGTSDPGARETLRVGEREGQHGAATPWWNGSDLQAEIPEGVAPESKYRSEVFWEHASGQPFRVGAGDHLSCEYTLTPHLGATTQDRDQWQVLWQLHGPAKDGQWPQPPLNLHVRADTWRIGGGAGRPDGREDYATPFEPFVDGKKVTWRIDVDVSTDPKTARVDAWLDGRHVVRDWHPPSGTMYPAHDWLGVKTGLYVGTTGGAPIATQRRYTTQDLLQCSITKTSKTP